MIFAIETSLLFLRDFLQHIVECLCLFLRDGVSGLLQQGAERIVHGEAGPAKRFPVKPVHGGPHELLQTSECLIQIRYDIADILNSNTESEKSVMKFIRIQVLPLIIFSEENDQTLIMPQRYRRCDNLQITDEAIMHVMAALEAECYHAAEAG